MSNWQLLDNVCLVMANELLLHLTCKRAHQVCLTHAMCTSVQYVCRSLKRTTHCHAYVAQVPRSLGRRREGATKSFCCFQLMYFKSLQKWGVPLTWSSLSCFSVDVTSTLSEKIRSAETELQAVFLNSWILYKAMWLRFISGYVLLVWKHHATVLYHRPQPVANSSVQILVHRTWLIEVWVHFFELVLRSRFFDLMIGGNHKWQYLQTCFHCGTSRE